MPILWGPRECSVAYDTDAVSKRDAYTGHPSNVVTVKSDNMAWLTSSKLNSLLRHSRMRSRGVSFTNTKYSPLHTPHSQHMWICSSRPTIMNI